MMHEKQITTYSTSINKTYCVSTAYRQCSSVYNPCWYYETIVWEYDKDGYINKIKYQTSDGSYFKSALATHNKLVKIFTYLVQRKSTNTK